MNPTVNSGAETPEYNAWRQVLSLRIEANAFVVVDVVAAPAVVDGDDGGGRKMILLFTTKPPSPGPGPRFVCIHNLSVSNG